MSLQILAVGLPRTGTSSLKQALIDLGYDKCMHMDELFNQPKLVDLWVELYETGKTDTDTLFAGYQSSTDIPAALLYKELLGVYPDLKIILNTRDAESWYTSMANTVYPVVPKTDEAKAELKRKGDEIHPRFHGIAKTLKLVEVYLLNRFLEGDFEDKEKTIAKYNAHLNEVREFVPADQLLEFDVKDGWGPLCAYLGADVPEHDFPHKNTTANFQQQVGGMILGGGKLEIK
ncbi:MAG: sulfotransferase family protein [Bacteroidota bacterium]